MRGKIRIILAILSLAVCVTVTILGRRGQGVGWVSVSVIDREIRSTSYAVKFDWDVLMWERFRSVYRRDGYDTDESWAWWVQRKLEDRGFHAGTGHSNCHGPITGTVSGTIWDLVSSRRATRTIVETTMFTFR